MRRGAQGANGTWEWAQLAVPATLAGTALAGYLGNRLATRSATRRGRELNERLEHVEFPVRTRPLPPRTSELSPEELRWLRLPLELALQPIDSFEGFTKIDQFREAATRYQLNYIGYALAIAQYTRTPAFTGYYAEAQRNAIEKMLDRRVWRYWALENLWGNLRWNPDPIAHDNVMLSGYYGLQIGLYERTTGDERYNRPGALTFRWSERSAYEWDFHSLAETEHRKMSASPFCMYPCEPNWAFPFCNAMSLNAQILHDRLHGSAYAEDSVPRYRESFDNEFVRPDGRSNVIRSRRLGIAVPFSVVTVADAVVAFWMNPGLPDVAQRTWWYIRDRLLQLSNGRAEVAMRGWDSLDPGGATPATRWRSWCWPRGRWAMRRPPRRSSARWRRAPRPSSAAGHARAGAPRRRARLRRGGGHERSGRGRLRRAGADRGGPGWPDRGAGAAGELRGARVGPRGGRDAGLALRRSRPGPRRAHRGSARSRRASRR